jgi:signal transduction histidine kinase
MLDSYRYYVKGAGASLALLEHDVAQLVAEAVSAARMTDYANGRVIDMSGAEHVRCMCDRQKIKQVLMHLIRNGCEAVPQRGRVAVTVTKEAEDMVIAVTDDGPGIAPERMEKIWEPFYSTKTESGLGLGLDLCRSIIEWHRGTIQCRSEPGCGATFTVRLPREVTTE